ncbi:MAG TPA: F0F1 ATP synthase subunit delta [Chthoniobacterales bacterium]
MDSVVAERPRNYIGVLENYQRLLRLEVEKRRAVVESAVALAPEVSAQVVASLQRKYGQDLTAEFAVNPEVLGGMRIRVGSDVWDGTVRNRLERLQQQL